MSMPATILSAPDGYDALQEDARISDVLLSLLTTYPNTIIGFRDVGKVIGYPVASSAVGMAATRLRAGKRGSFGLNIASALGRGGGYVLIVPVPATGEQMCDNCPSRTRLWTCPKMRHRPVERGLWCWGWGRG